MTAKLKFEDIKAHAQQLKAGSGNREASYNEVEEMYLLKDNDLPSEDHIKKTISPDARNVVQGVVRLLCGAEPIFTVPFDEDEPGAEATSTKLEKFAQAAWASSNKTRKRMVEHDAALMALLYDEVHIVVQSTKEMARLSKDPRLEKLAEECPLIFEVLPSKICNPQYDVLGLVAHYSERSMKVVDVITRWGSKAEKLLTGRSLYSNVTYCEYWNTTIHCVWIAEAGDQPIILVDHGFGFIPIASALVEGSELFDEESGQETRQMFLYGLMKSGLWKRQNLALTSLYTMIALTGTSTQFILHQGTPEDDVTIDLSKEIGVIKVPPTAKNFQQMQKNTIDPAVQQGLDIAERLGQESTIYSTALGQNMDANSYSMVALLNQIGRLPLTEYQRILSLLISEAMKIGLSILKQEGGAKVKAATKGKKSYSVVTLEKEDIPDNVSIDASLDVNQPQDDRSNAQLAAELTNPTNPLTSKRWAREKILKVGQSDDMEEEIWGEQAATLAWRGFVQQNLPMLIQMMTGENPIAGSPGGGQGQPMGQPGGQPQQQGPTPEQMAQLQQMQQMSEGQSQGVPMAAPRDLSAVPVQGAQGENMPPDLSSLSGMMGGGGYGG
jgi:hypothetical protein